MSSKRNVLVLCSRNSARSQMAEGWLRHLAADRFEGIYSAGIESAEVNPLAIQAMQDVGIDISEQRSESLDMYLGRVSISYLIIVCDAASESCPRIWPGVLQRQIWPFDDPAAASGSEEERLNEFRRVRDEIRDRIEQWLAEFEMDQQDEQAAQSH